MRKKDCHLEWPVFKKAIMNSKLSWEEEKKLKNWLKISKKNRNYYQKAKKHYQLYLSAETFPETDYTPAWEEFLRHTQKSKNLHYQWWIKIAAFLVIIISTYYLINFVRENRQEISETVTDHIIEPGKPVAKLYFDNGQMVLLGDKDTLISLDGTNTEIIIDSGTVNYRDHKQGKPKYTRYNKIEVPKGGEYHITLADGSNIWLNAESTLEYSIPFSSEQREVTLSGEAYLEVVHENDRPFIVKTQNMNISVLGTSFNICVYPDEIEIKTTLVEGKICVEDIKGLSESFILEPSQQLTFNKISHESHVKMVDTEIYTAWVHGYFIFEEESLENIFQRLGRWYDIQVFFLDDNLKRELLSGKLPRFEDFHVILNMLEKVSDAKFELNGNTIIVK